MREFCCIQLLFNGKTNWMFLLVGLFKALWLMVTFLASLNSVDILIFQRRSIFRSLIFGPDFPELCPHWMFHPFFKAPRAHQKMKGKAKYAWIRQKLTFRPGITRSSISFIKHFGEQAAAARLAFLWCFFRKYCPTHPNPPATQSQNLHWKPDGGNWAVWPFHRDQLS